MAGLQPLRFADHPPPLQPMPEAVGHALPERERMPPTRILVFCSGKGGTGRTTLAAALALAAIEAGLRVRLVDADPATAGLTQGLVGGEASLHGALLPVEEFEAAVRQAEAAAAAASRPSAASPRATALQSILHGLSDAGLHDLVLVDAPAGIGIDSLALAGAADGLVLVAEPAGLRAGQARRFFDALEARRPRGERADWCGVIVNRAPPGLDGSDLARLGRDIGPGVDRIARVALDAPDAPDLPDAHARQDVRLHESVAGEHAATRFADEAMRAFDVLLAREIASWPESARERWRALVASKAREAARADAQRELEAAARRKRLEGWPRLEEECRHLAAEVDRLRLLHADDLLRQGRQVEDLRIQVRVLRASLETAQARANVRRTRALASVGLGFASGALLALIAVASLGDGAGLVAIEDGLPFLTGLLGRPAAAPKPQPQPGSDPPAR